MQKRQIRLTDEQKADLVRDHLMGFRPVSIAKKFNCSVSTVANVIKKAKEAGTYYKSVN